MSDEKDDKWVMPEPVFRSSPGALPKSLQKTISGYNMPTYEMPTDDEDEGDILSVMDTDGQGQMPPATAVPAEAEESPLELTTPVDEVSVPEDAVSVDADQPVAAISAAPTTASESKPMTATTTAERKGGIGSFVVIFLIIAAVAAGLIYGIYAYLTARSANSGPF